MHNVGLLPESVLSLLWPFVAIVLFAGYYEQAKKRNVLRWYTSGFAVSFWEELLFRSLILGALLTYFNSWLAVILSSLLFGLFHLRNLWWANRQRVLWMCVYTGIIIGPLLGWIRITTGDIYLGIFLHFLNNFLSVFHPSSLDKFYRPIPSDSTLAAKRK